MNAPIQVKVPSPSDIDGRAWRCGYIDRICDGTHTCLPAFENSSQLPSYLAGYAYAMAEERI